MSKRRVEREQRLRDSTGGAREATPRAREVPALVHEGLRSPSQPLAPEVREAMEARLGHDFSRVRVHLDATADASARAVDANAFTVGRDVVFRAGKYQPDTARGQRLLAHELVHVAQQGDAGDVPPEALVLGAPGSAAEQQAHRLARGDAGAGRVGVASTARWTVQRQVASEPEQPEQEAKRDPGAERARVAQQLVQRLRAAGTKYGHELVTRTTKKGSYTESARDWEGTKEADCSKFVQWALEGSGEGELFGRDKAQTGEMQNVIKRLAELKKADAPRTDNPKVGDLILWGGHVAIVTELQMKRGEQYIVFAHMGLSGANEIGNKDRTGKQVYWLKVSELPTRKELASGEFLGYWTPP